MSKYSKMTDESELLPRSAAVASIYKEHLEKKEQQEPGEKEKKKRKKKKKNKIQLPVFDDYDYRPNVVDLHQYADFDRSSDREGNDIPECMLLEINSDPGVVFGLKRMYGSNRYVGMAQGTESNITVIGSNGSGKSLSTGKTTLAMWQGAIVATDIKGELSSYYRKLYEAGIVKRPFIVFDPLDIDGISYDPFWWLKEGG